MTNNIGQQITDLEKKLVGAESADERSETLNKLALALRFSKPDQSEKFAKEALSISSENNNLLQKLIALRLIAYAEDMGNKQQDALIHILEAKTIAQSIGLVDEIIPCNNLIGKIFMYLHDLPAALKLFQENANLAEQTGNQISQADAILTQAVVHFRNNDFETCIPLFKKSLSLSREIGYDGGIGRALLNLSASYIETKKFEDGLAASSEAIPLFEQNGNLIDLAHAISNNATSNVALGHYLEAEQGFIKVRKIRYEINDVAHLPNSFISTAEVYMLMGRFDEAERDLSEASRLVEKLENKIVHAHLYEIKYKFYEAKGLFKEALETHKKLFLKVKELTGEERDRDLRNMNLRFEIEKVEKEKEVYRLHSIEVEEANHKIKEQKQLIEEKNKDITDSIHYARRIQEAMLPLEEEFKILFPKSFVLYKPKDIISGDFFWCKESGDTLVLAVADCTGHGVPGALMSMIGHNLLNQSLNECGIDSPAAILESLDNGMRKILKQESGDEGGNDGMDIALCTIFPQQKKMIFSSAKRPLWILRNGEMIETKGERHPVGGKMDQERKFKNHFIDIESEDILFLFTDGYADQFGGPSGKKFQTGRLKKNILKNSPSSIEELHIAIEKDWLDWRGTLEQVDDILVIGIKLD